jgi:hypothetical protein
MIIILCKTIPVCFDFERLCAQICKHFIPYKHAVIHSFKNVIVILYNAIHIILHNNPTT